MQCYLPRVKDGSVQGEATLQGTNQGEWHCFVVAVSDTDMEHVIPEGFVLIDSIHKFNI